MCPHSNKHGFAPLAQQTAKEQRYFVLRRYSSAAYYVAMWMVELGSQKNRRVMLPPMETVADAGLIRRLIVAGLVGQAAYPKWQEQ